MYLGILVDAADSIRAVVEVLLERGFRVRATTRSEAKAASFTQHFTKKFPSAEVEFVAFSDYATPEGYGKVLESELASGAAVHLHARNRVPI